MSVFTLVQRALSFALPWKRRHSTTSKEKEQEIEISNNDTHEDTFQPEDEKPQRLGTTLPCDVDTVHIAVKTRPDSRKTAGHASGETFETDSQAESDYQIDQISDNDNRTPTRTRTSRVVSWASIVRNKPRWTQEQENQLLNARTQLVRCQKAWSSEQEVWLDHVRFHFDIPLRADEDDYQSVCHGYHREYILTLCPPCQRSKH